MIERKGLRKDSIPRALEKADRYRLLNEPVDAESICLDVLDVEPENQRALITLILALADQFRDEESAGVEAQSQSLLAKVRDEYERAYYSGVVCERIAKASLVKLRTAGTTYEWLRKALDHFAKAEAVRPPGNDDAILRWNTCVRILERNPRLKAGVEEWVEPYLE